MPDLILTAADVGITAADGVKLPRVSILAYSGDVMTVPGFGPIVLDLKGMVLAAEIPLLADHVAAIGSIVGQGRPEVRAGQLFVNGTCNITTEAAKQIVELAKNGHRFQASIGATPLESRRITAGETIQANGRTIKAASSFLFVTKSRLREVTICALGCDATTSVSIAAKKESTMTTATADHNNILATERQRVSEIEATFKGLEFLCPENMQERADTLREEAINGGLSASDVQARLMKIQRDDVRLFKLRAERPQGPAIRASQQHYEFTHQTIEATLLIRAGREALAEKSYGPQVMESTRMIRARSLPDLCGLCCQMDGRETAGMNTSELIRAGFSTTSLPTALGNAMGKTLIDSYRESAATWRSFAKVMPAASFRPQTGLRPSAVGQLEELGAHGEIKHSQLLESTYPWHIGTFAKMLTVDRQAVINDDTSFISETPVLFGKMASRGVSDLVWGTILANAGSFFSSGHSNLLEAGSALTLTSLGLAISRMRSQRDANGNDIDILPAVLACPPELETLARSIINSALTSSVSAAEIAPTGNALQNIVKLEVESRLSNTTKFSTASATGWYLFGTPLDAPLIVGFLDGVEAPTVEVFGFDHDVNTLALSFRVFFDYGAALGDFRAAVAATGAA